MAAKKKTGKGAADAAPNQEFQALLDSVPLPSVTRAESMFDEAAMRRLGRLALRVERWVETRSASEVALRLALEIFQRRVWQRDWGVFCETLSEDRAKSAYQRKKARQGKGFRHWPEVKSAWLDWQENPDRYSDFKAAMEVRFPGCNPGTLSNRITTWKKELAAQNGDS